jgi:predicted metal-dependent hydrolase
MATPKSSKPQPYRVRESARAKHVSIRISHLGEVEIVIPKGFDRKQIPDIVKKRQDWIAKTTQRIVAERQTVPSYATPGDTTQLPKLINLEALPEQWKIQYEPTTANHVVVSKSGAQRLAIRGAVHSPWLCQRVLKQWLTRKGEIHLIPWLRQVSQEVELPFNRASIRGQKTLWASCSSKTNISLNYKLLFLPPHLVRYVFIHELCHTIHLNHSQRFWALVGEKEPDYSQFDAELNKAWIYIPEWVERGFGEE